MARELGNEQRGQDGDVGNAGLTDKKVDARSGYFDSLKERLGTLPRAVERHKPGARQTQPGEAASEPEKSQEPEKPTFVTYGDDGMPE